MMTPEHAIITRPYDPRQFAANAQESIVVPISQALTIEPTPFYTITQAADIKDATSEFEQLYTAYQSIDPEAARKVFAHCRVLEPEVSQYRTPNIMLFASDVRLGNIKREGFLRLVIDPTREDMQKSAKRQLKELFRYMHSEVIEVNGFYFSQ